MTFQYNKEIKHNAQSLRRNMTNEERNLWYRFLKDLPIKVRRQKMIGNYIVDFYCARAKVAIELDGSQHYEDDGVKYDTARDEYLNSLGITVLRYSNRDIKDNFEAVCEDILLKFNLK